MDDRVDSELLKSGFLDAGNRSMSTHGRSGFSSVFSFFTNMKKRYIIIVALLVIYAIICAPLYMYQNDLIYSPRGADIRKQASEPWAHHQTRSDDEELHMLVDFGEPSRPTVIYLHGRSETVTYGKNVVGEYRGAGMNVIMPEYPGFSETPGYPTEENLKLSADKAYEWAVAHGADPEKIIIHGNSLGAGPALHLARKQHGYLVLTAPVASMGEIVTSWVPFFPDMIMFQPWDNLAAAKDAYRSPAIVVHAKEDGVVPFSHGKRLAKALGSEFDEMEGNDHTLAYRGEVQKRILSEIEKAISPDGR